MDGASPLVVVTVTAITLDEPSARVQGGNATQVGGDPDVAVDSGP